VLDALQFQKVDHYVPKSLGGIYKATHPFPRKVKELIGKALKADKVMMDIDAEARRAYVDRTTGAVAIGTQAEDKEKVG
jgi:hypothetical protein